MKYYHVCENGWNGKDLLSLNEQYDYDTAIEKFIERWPEAEAIADMEVERVYLYTTLDEAKRHQKEYGGEIVEIEADAEMDSYEGYPYVRGRIAKENIKRI